jgi:hypothetical protein
MIGDGPFYSRNTRMWCFYIDGEPMTTAGEVRYWLTAEDARDVAETEIYGPRRKAKQ